MGRALILVIKSALSTRGARKKALPVPGMRGIPGMGQREGNSIASPKGGAKA